MILTSMLVSILKVHYVGLSRLPPPECLGATPPFPCMYKNVRWPSDARIIPPTTYICAVLLFIPGNAGEVIVILNCFSDPAA